MGHDKKCVTCQLVLSTGEFHRNKSTEDGFHKQCKRCRKAYSDSRRQELNQKQRTYYTENKEWCQDAVDRWRERHPDRVRDQARRWRSAHREGVKSYKKVYARTDRGKAISARARHRRRSREANVTNDLTVEQWNMILRKQKGRCVMCGEKFSKKLFPTRDHIVPVSKGGGLTVTNVVALCQPCNTKKHDGEPLYVAQRGLI